MIDKRKIKKGSGKSRRSIEEVMSEIGTTVRPTIKDGHGNEWVDFCEECNEHFVLEVVRPGKVQCGKCGR